MNKDETINRRNKMKIALILLLIIPYVHSQEVNTNLTVIGVQIQSLIKGDWDLSKVEMVDGYDIYIDSTKLTQNNTRNHKITFTSDSLYNHRDTTLRYYIRQQNYLYKIVYDSVINKGYIKLFSGKKRKMLEVESYEIVKCSFDELVIKSYKFEHNGLEYSSHSTVYTYKKSSSNQLNDILLKHQWFYSSNRQSSFLDEVDSLTYVFSNTDNHESCRNSQERITLTFDPKDYHNFMTYTHSNLNEGVLVVMQYMIDSKSNLIYIDSSSPRAYNIELLNEENLVISLNDEVTAKLINTYSPP